MPLAVLDPSRLGPKAALHPGFASTKQAEHALAISAFGVNLSAAGKNPGLVISGGGGEGWRVHLHSHLDKWASDVVPSSRADVLSSFNPLSRWRLRRNRFWRARAAWDVSGEALQKNT